MKIKVHLAKPEHEVLYKDLVALVSRHADKLTAVEILAIAANMVGKLIAMQDQRTMTPAMAMETVIKNLQAGNEHVLAELRGKTEGRA